MAKWLCPCGAQIRSSGGIPNPQEWHILSDNDLDGMTTDGDQKISPEDFLQRSHYVYRCDDCDRLHVFWKGLDDSPPTIYVREIS